MVSDASGTLSYCGASLQTRRLFVPHAHAWNAVQRARQMNMSGQATYAVLIDKFQIGHNALFLVLA